jgi:uncharacterized protein YegP (UPF0339 family)
MKLAKFEVWKNAAGEWQWHLRASNGRIVAAGEGYKRRSGAIQGTVALQRSARMAKLVVAAA